MASFFCLLGASWRLFGCSWGGVLGNSRWLPSYFNNHSGALLSHQSGPQSMVKGPQEPSKRARWPQDAIKIHAKTSSKQFSFEFVTFRASQGQTYVQTSRAVRFSMTLGPPTCSMSLWLLACSVKLRPSRMPSDLRPPACSVRPACSV